ncbi:MAG: hypothetical protein M3003_04175, partial [Candidatus Dormibacteraeota bacterium]|nr:hypothetical protein [Candidatus Dormibacteraeota bacterium]
MSSDDDDPVMARIFDHAFAGVHVPPLEAIRARRSRRSGPSLAAALALIAVLVIAGAIGGWLGGRRVPAAAPAPLDCGAPTTLAPHPQDASLTGAPIGPLLIRGYYGEGATTAVVQGFTPGYPTKMLALIARDMQTNITLTGVRCSDGQPLRFWMGPNRNDTPFPQGDLPVSEQRMATTGQLDPTFEALQLPTTGGVIDEGGYMLFPSVGTYRIEGFAGGTKIGAVTLLVTSEVPPAVTPATPPCPVTNRHDAAGVAVSSGDIGLVETRPGSFPGERLIVLVRRGAGIGDSLELHATAVGSSAGGEVWSTPATARTTTWGTVVFEVNSKPIGNVGCWRLSRLDAPPGDPGIVIDLGPPVTHLGAAQVVEVDGYRFTVQLLFDPAYGLHAADTARTSDLEGVGLRCTWTRTGPDVPDATELFGPIANPSTPARWAPLRTGLGGDRSGGFPPTASPYANVTDVVCGMRDASGDHGVEINVWFGRAGP